jgi:nicotinamidase-related amidase
MPLSTLDPVTALVVIDLQKGVVGIPCVHPMDEIVSNSARLAAAFRAHGLPVVLVNATGRAPGRTEAAARPAGGAPPQPDWVDLVPELNAAPDDLLISKQTWGAFHGTPLHERLQERNVTQVVLTGVATTAGVESTARAAYEHGYNVVLVTDAMTDRDAAAHDNSVRWVFPRLGETATTGEILARLP